MPERSQTKTQGLPPQLPATTMLLQQQQHTVKLCSNYNSVAVTEKKVWGKRYSVIPNVFSAWISHNSVIANVFSVIPNVFFGCSSLG